MPDSPESYALRNLLRTREDNLGGLEARVWYTLAANLLDYPAEGPLVIKQLSMRAGTYWYQLVSTRGTVRYKQTPKAQGRHGDIYTQRLAGVKARHSDHLALGLEALEGQQLVALYRDHNGQVQLLGTPEQPLTWQDTFDSGQDPGNRNNYDWILAAETPRRARPYHGSWLVWEGGLEYALDACSTGLVTIYEPDGTKVGEYPPGTTVILPPGNKSLIDGGDARYKGPRTPR